MLGNRTAPPDQSTRKPPRCESGSTRNMPSRYVTPECRHAPQVKVNAYEPCPAGSTYDTAHVVVRDHGDDSTVAASAMHDLV
jgi:hypothetical protein